MSQQPPLRILIAALGGEGGGVLMNWIVAAARLAGKSVQATSVPGVAQRTGSTSYYIEIGGDVETQKPVLSLLPMPGKVDVLLCSELAEAGRMLSAGFATPELTTLISSSSRVLTTAEKMHMGDGRYADDGIVQAAKNATKQAFIFDLAQMAIDEKTFISATMYGALAGAGILPWGDDVTQAALGSGKAATASMGGYQAAKAKVESLRTTQAQVWQPEAPVNPQAESLAEVKQLGQEKLLDYQNAKYVDLYNLRVDRLHAKAATDSFSQQAVIEAARRLALWMAYEDVARVADLKTRKQRFAQIREEVQLQPGQILTVVDYLKPRPEEVADIMPVAIGKWIMKRNALGKGLPFFGKGMHLKSNSIRGYWSLRLMSQLRRIRPASYRYQQEQQAIEDWLQLVAVALHKCPEFAVNLAELPRLIKGYSDTLERGKQAFEKIMQLVVKPAFESGDLYQANDKLRQALDASMADDKHHKLQQVIDREEIKPLRIVDLGGAANAS